MQILPDTQAARDLYTLVERGDVDQMSFAFRVIRQKWSEDRSRRVLTEAQPFRWRCQRCNLPGLSNDDS